MGSFYNLLSQEEYLRLLDWSGREIKKDKSGAIPSDLAPIFDRLEVNRELWIESLRNYKSWFYQIVGKFESAVDLLRNVTNNFFRGGKVNRDLFG